jgi:hypothetical protein
VVFFVGGGGEIGLPDTARTICWSSEGIARNDHKWTSDVMLHGQQSRLNPVSAKSWLGIQMAAL